MPQTENSRLLIELMRVGWGGAVPAFRQVFSSFFIPNAGEEQKRWYDEMQQVSSSGEMAARLWLSNAHLDISDTARRVTQPALVLHGAGTGPFRTRRARLASLLPDASFVTLESENHILQDGEPAWELFLAEVRAFLGDDEQEHAMAADLSDLSEREREVLELVAVGMSNEAIAERLFRARAPSSAISPTSTRSCGFRASPRAPPPPRASRVPDLPARCYPHRRGLALALVLALGRDPDHVPGEAELLEHR